MKKWYIKRTPENCVFVNKWFKDQGYGDPYLHDHPIGISDDGKEFVSALKDIAGRTEITFDQFLKYVVQNSGTKENKFEMKVTKTSILTIGDVQREVTVTVLSEPDGKIRAGYSVLNPLDKQSENLGKKISLGRAMNDRTNLVDMYLGQGMEDKKYILYSILEQIQKDLSNQKIKIKGIK